VIEAMRMNAEAMRMNAEAMRMNIELARSSVDRFPAVMDSTAGILRAADGAGLPAREPRRLLEPAEGDDEPQTEEVAAKPNGSMRLLEMIPRVAPAIMSSVASGKSRSPAAWVRCSTTGARASRPVRQHRTPRARRAWRRRRVPSTRRRHGAAPRRFIPRQAGIPSRAHGGAPVVDAPRTRAGRAEAPEATASAAKKPAAELPTLAPAALGALPDLLT
jgi:hypothetical protein